jgi:hypothetical protein
MVRRGDLFPKGQSAAIENPSQIAPGYNSLNALSEHAGANSQLCQRLYQLFSRKAHPRAHRGKGVIDFVVGWGDALFPGLFDRFLFTYNRIDQVLRLAVCG